MQSLDGLKVAKKIEEEICTQIKNLHGSTPTLCAFCVGDDPASHLYLSRKAKACAAVGIHFIRKNFQKTISEKVLLTEIDKANKSRDIDGILVQLPLPPSFSLLRVMEHIHPDKDVDGFHPLNMGRLVMGEGGRIPCTPLGIKELLTHYGLFFEGKKVVIIGRSITVGRPLSLLFSQNNNFGNASVTLLHHFSKDITTYTKEADAIIVATGKENMLTGEMIKKGAIVVDVGIHVKINGGKRTLVGDVDFLSVAPKCSFISPVPGGVGPMTVAMLLRNTLDAYFCLRRNNAS